MEIVESDVVVGLQRLLLVAGLAVRQYAAERGKAANSRWRSTALKTASDRCREIAVQMMLMAKRVVPDTLLAGELVCASHSIDALLAGETEWHWRDSQTSLRRIMEKRRIASLDALGRSAVWNTNVHRNDWALKTADDSSPASSSLSCGVYHPIAAALETGDVATLEMTAIVFDTDEDWYPQEYPTTVVVLGAQAGGYAGMMTQRPPFAEAPQLGSVIGFGPEHVVNAALTAHLVIDLVNPSDLCRVLNAARSTPPPNCLGALTYTVRRHMRLLHGELARSLGVDCSRIKAWESGKSDTDPEVRAKALQWLRDQIPVYLPERAKRIRLPEA